MEERAAPTLDQIEAGSDLVGTGLAKPIARPLHQPAPSLVQAAQGSWP